MEISGNPKEQRLEIENATVSVIQGEGRSPSPDDWQQGSRFFTRPQHWAKKHYSHAVVYPSFLQ
jgi:hypothetical protein